MIRQPHPDEASAVREIVRAAYAHYVRRIGTEPGPMGDDYTRRIADGEVWVLDRNGVLVGVLVLENQPDALLLDNVAVLPARHGEGNGRALLAFAEATAQTRGYRKIVLYTHEMMTENQALYSRMGYRETDRRTDHGFPRVFMAKPLAAT